MANNIIVDNTVIDYSTINNMVSNISSVQKNIERSNNSVKFKKSSVVSSDAIGTVTKDLLDVKIEALKYTFTSTGKSFSQEVSFDTAFSSQPTISITIQTTDTKASPTIFFNQNSNDFKKMNVTINAINPNSLYTLHILAIGS